MQEVWDMKPETRLKTANTLIMGVWERLAPKSPEAHDLLRASDLIEKALPTLHKATPLIVGELLFRGDIETEKIQKF